MKKHQTRQAAILNGFHSPFFLDGITYNYAPIRTLYISIFNGNDWDISDKPVTE